MSPCTPPGTPRSGDILESPKRDPGQSRPVYVQHRVYGLPQPLSVTSIYRTYAPCCSPAGDAEWHWITAHATGPSFLASSESRFKPVKFPTPKTHSDVLSEGRTPVGFFNEPYRHARPCGFRGRTLTARVQMYRSCQTISSRVMQLSDGLGVPCAVGPPSQPVAQPRQPR